MDIYQALKKDHDKLKTLLSELLTLNEDTKSVRKHELIEKIRDELIPHSRAEEAVLYNSLRMLDSTKDLGMHGYTEHMAAETLLRSLQGMDVLHTSWKATAEKLTEALEHHIQEEETEMFSAAQSVFSEEEAVAMAQTFEAMKPEIKEEGLMKTTLDMVANMMPPRLAQTFTSFDITNRV